MTIELKTVVILNGEIINVGEWGSNELTFVSNQLEIDEAKHHNETANESEFIEVPEPILKTVKYNPIPEGATVEQREMILTDENGWRDVNWRPESTLEDYTLDLEFRLSMIELGF